MWNGIDFVNSFCCKNCLVRYFDFGIDYHNVLFYHWKENESTVQIIFVEILIEHMHLGIDRASLSSSSRCFFETSRDGMICSMTIWAIFFICRFILVIWVFGLSKHKLFLRRRVKSLSVQLFCKIVNFKCKIMCFNFVVCNIFSMNKFY